MAIVVLFSKKKNDEQIQKYDPHHGIQLVCPVMTQIRLCICVVSVKPLLCIRLILGPYPWVRFPTGQLTWTFLITCTTGVVSIKIVTSLRYNAVAVWNTYHYHCVPGTSDEIIAGKLKASYTTLKQTEHNHGGILKLKRHICKWKGNTFWKQHLASMVLPRWSPQLTNRMNTYRL